MKGEIVICTSPSLKVECGNCPTVLESPCKNTEHADNLLNLWGWGWKPNIGWLCPKCIGDKK